MNELPISMCIIRMCIGKGNSLLYVATFERDTCIQWKEAKFIESMKKHQFFVFRRFSICFTSEWSCVKGIFLLLAHQYEVQKSVWLPELGFTWFYGFTVRRSTSLSWVKAWPAWPHFKALVELRALFTHFDVRNQGGRWERRETQGRWTVTWDAVIKSSHALWWKCVADRCRLFECPRFEGGPRQVRATVENS